MMNKKTYEDLCQKCVSKSTCDELKCENYGSIWDISSPDKCNTLKDYCENVEEYFSSCLSIPLHQKLDEDDVDYVVEHITKFLC